MTFCKELKSETVGDYDVSAWEMTEKFERVPRYEISVSKGSIGLYRYPCARTTWKKKFREVVDELKIYNR